MKEKPLTEFLKSKKIMKEKVKKEEVKRAPKLKEVEGPWELPEGWKWVRLRDVIEKIERVNPTNTPDWEFWYVDIASIDNVSYKIVKPKKLLGREAPSRARRRIREGDVIFATTRPYLKNVAIVPKELDGQVCSTGFAVLRAKKEKTMSKWIFYYLISDFALFQILPNMRGANYPAVTDREVFSIKIPLPPLEEQKRIVAKLDEIHAKFEEAKRLAREAKEQAEKLMASALHEIFSKAEEKGWEWVRLEKIGKIRKDTINPIDYPEELFELYSIPAYHSMGKPELKFGREIKSNKFVVKPGDILFGKLNPHLPKVWIVGPNKGYRQISSTELLPIVVEKTKIETRYLYWYLLSPQVKDELVRKVIGTTGSRKRIGKADLLNMKIPLPSLDEQRCIVSYLDSISERTQKLVKLYEERERELERLFPAILDRAFRGELV